MTRLAQDCYHGSETCRLMNLRKTTLPGGFFVYRARDYAQKKRISRRSFSERRIPSFHRQQFFIIHEQTTQSIDMVVYPRE
ncbi:hypothetical protein QMW13_27085, partial [Klebsiella quasipneumoniae]|nr:hypothetical protein [Klebsiella quasipneumoniae]